MPPHTDEPVIINTDYVILKSLQDEEQALWKTKIHGWIAEQIDVLPITAPVSLQTVGRRVDRLRHHDLVDDCLTSPNDAERDLIIAYRLTENGEQRLEQKRDQMLKEIVRNTMFADEDTALSIGKQAAVELIGDKFALSSDSRRIMDEDYTADELVLLLNMYYTNKEADRIFSDENRWKVKEVVSKNTELAQLICLKDVGD